MRKIPTLILALFMLTSNLAASSVFAYSEGSNTVAVGAIVETHISASAYRGYTTTSTNVASGVWIITKTSSIYTTKPTYTLPAAANQAIVVGF